MDKTILDLLTRCKVVPVIQINQVEHAAPLAKALVDNGLPVAEVTFRTDVAAEVIKAMKAAEPSLCVGAGTLLTREQIDRAMDAGAEFGVAPGLNPTTATYCKEKGFPFIPGINNPGQIEQAMELGFSLLKFFPAEASGGIAMVKSLLAPYREVQLMPTGGIKPSNLLEYLAVDRVICCGGTWLTETTLMDAGNWDEISNRIRETVTRVN
ncbi:bifunctional 4-hydroxy-2-oxoglutarate aldolase/2-dehydro-3-deoxy-phosphogluconate aldolase [Parasalinivibrio latis]|uniref:bifunctional 4-hydroxy-2-oxoglutarate aldolase/2-dehydro-3-deoxy-phosphogluconate aldolase n=1 Tax=Parasalinivibrio latis TaxID=2952610 RepID=UPI0030E56E89